MSATLFAVRGQAYRISVKIVSSATANPITGGLTDLTAQVSIDGAAFTSTGVTADEIETSGYVLIDIDATRMTGDLIVLKVTASNTNAVEASVEIKTARLSEVTGRADAAAVLRLEAFLRQLWQAEHDKKEIDRTAGTQKRYLSDSSTVSVQGTVSDDGNTGTMGKLS